MEKLLSSMVHRMAKFPYLTKLLELGFVIHGGFLRELVSSYYKHMESIPDIDIMNYILDGGDINFYINIPEENLLPTLPSVNFLYELIIVGCKVEYIGVKYNNQDSPWSRNCNVVLSPNTFIPIPHGTYEVWIPMGFHSFRYEITFFNDRYGSMITDSNINSLFLEQVGHEYVISILKGVGRIQNIVSDISLNLFVPSGRYNKSEELYRIQKLLKRGYKLHPNIKENIKENIDALISFSEKTFQDISDSILSVKESDSFFLASLTSSDTVPTTSSDTVPTTSSDTVPTTSSDTVPTTSSESLYQLNSYNYIESYNLRIPSSSFYYSSILSDGSALIPRSTHPIETANLSKLQDTLRKLLSEVFEVSEV